MVRGLFPTIDAHRLLLLLVVVLDAFIAESDGLAAYPADEKDVAPCAGLGEPNDG